MGPLDLHTSWYIYPHNTPLFGNKLTNEYQVEVKQNKQKKTKKEKSRNNLVGIFFIAIFKHFDDHPRKGNVGKKMFSQKLIWTIEFNRILKRWLIYVVSHKILRNIWRSLMKEKGIKYHSELKKNTSIWSGWKEFFGKTFTQKTELKHKSCIVNLRNINCIILLACQNLN